MHSSMLTTCRVESGFGMPPVFTIAGRRQSVQVGPQLDSEVVAEVRSQRRWWEAGSAKSSAIGSEPLEAGVIRFVPVGGTKGPMATVAVADGCYAVSAADGPVVGTHRVEIEATDFLGFPPDDEAAARRALRATGGRLPPSPVPAGYSGRRSPLTADIPPEGREELNFRLAPRGPTAARR